MATPKKRLKTIQEVKAALNKFGEIHILSHYTISYQLMQQVLVDDSQHRMRQMDRQLTPKEVKIYMKAPILWPRRKRGDR
jgi:hypothetical protein